MYEEPGQCERRKWCKRGFKHCGRGGHCSRKAPKIGAPTVSGASVVAEVVEQTRADKVTVIKFKRRKNYHRTKGHRQHHTVLKITSIAAKAAAKAKAKTAAAETEDKSEE